MKSILLMVRKETIKSEDIQVIYSRSANLRDLLIKGYLQQTQSYTRCQLVENTGVKPAKMYKT